jgi:hypothetical protein
VVANHDSTELEPQNKNEEISCSAPYCEDEVKNAVF